MKKKLLLPILLLCCLFAFFCGCDAQNAGELKNITHPYLNEYECTQARLGEEDLLKRFDFIKITLADENKLEISFKPKDGKKYTVTGEYERDEKTGEITCKTGVLGVELKEKIILKKGKFTITKQFGEKMLVLNFEAT